jgi:carboxymethylenebutenolidase
MGAIVEFASNGGTASGYLATPPSGDGLPLVVIQEWWGLVPHIQDVCDRFAAEGFVALAPDLYHGAKTTEPDEAGKLMMALNIEQAANDLSGAVAKVQEVSGREAVGVTGFCMGGGLALVLACNRPDAIKACVPFYGLIPWPDAQPDWSTLAAAVQGHYAEQDGFFGPDQVKALQDQLRAVGVEADLYIHPGVDHAFCNDTRPEVYDAQEAQRAFADTFEFLKAELS